MSGVETVGKRKRVSKKNKKSWRKHTDIRDVDAFLEDKRLQERLGKPFSERKNEDLFVIDSAPFGKQLVPKRPKNKQPGCLRILENISAVTDPIVKRNRRKPPEEKRNPALKRIEVRKAKVILKREKDAIRNRRLTQERKQKIIGEVKYDVWEQDSGNKLGTDSEWMTEAAVYHTLKHAKKWAKKVPVALQSKPYSTPPLEVPHAGMSYNPSYIDHQNLLQEVADKELEYQKQEKHIKRVTTGMFKFVTDKENEKMWIEEMSQGLPKPVKEETKQENQSDTEFTSPKPAVKNKKRASEDQKKLKEVEKAALQQLQKPVKEETNQENQSDTELTILNVNPPVENKKKTLKARRKLKEARTAALERMKQKIEKKKIADIYKLRFLKEDIVTKEAKLEKVKEKREKIKAIKAQGTKQLSKVKFKPPDLEFNLQKEISGNLRSIVPQGSILEDRFYSFQMRNIIEPTVKKRAKKPKKKRFERKGHKVGWESQGY